MKDRPKLGENLSRKRALDAPPPGDGEVILTPLPDTFEGIRFEIGRMAKYVEEGRRDPIVVDAARLMAAHWGKIVQELSAQDGNPVDVHNNKVIQLEAIDVWCRSVACYLNDPTGVELIQTPRRMVKQTRMPREVLSPFLEPFYRALEASNPSFVRASREIPSIATLDCDEGAILVCSLAAALDIGPVAFRFGGSGGTLHHVWAYVQADGQWWNSDITDPTFKLGDFSEFEAYEEYEIPL